MTEPRTVQIRNVPADVHERFTRGAQARGMTMAEYLEALLKLHAEMLADSADPHLRQALERHGLSRVNV